MNPLFIKISCICSKSEGNWEKVFKPINFLTVSLTLKLNTMLTLSLEDYRNRLGQAMQVAFSMIQECIACWIVCPGFYPLLCNQVPDLTVKLTRSFRTKKLSNFLEEEICLYFFTFCLKNLNFLMCITWGRKVSEDRSLRESRVLPQSSCCSISPHLTMYSSLLF